MIASNLLLLQMSIFVIFTLIQIQGYTYCCEGPPNAFANPLGGQQIEKVTISVKNATAPIAFYEKLFKYQLQSTFSTPFGNITRIAFNNSVVIEFIERNDSVQGVQRPPPFNQTQYNGICQYSYRVKDYTRVSDWLAENGIEQIITPFYNDQLQLVLQMIYENTTNLIIEFLQPYDNSSIIVDWDANPMGIVGFNQVTQGVYDFFDVINWYEQNFGTIFPYQSFSNFTATSFKTMVGVSELGSINFETIFEIGAEPNPYPARNPPDQAYYEGYVSWAMRVQDIQQTRQALEQKNIDILYYYNSTSWGGYSMWIRDNNDVLVEFFQPFGSPEPTPEPTPQPTSDSRGSSSCSTDPNKLNDIGIAFLVMFLFSVFSWIALAFGVNRGYINVDLLVGKRRNFSSNGNGAGASRNPMQG